MLEIEKITTQESKPVYDIKVEDNENFFANNILVHNCTEINLYTSPIHDSKDGEVVKKKIKVKKEDYEKFLKYKKENHGLYIKKNK